MGPRITFVSSFAFSAIAGTIFLVVFHLKDVVPYTLFMTKLGIAAAFNVIYIANVTLFPSEIVTTTFGVCNVTGRIGAIAAPLIAELAEPVPLYFFVVMTSLFTAVSWFLKDSRTQEPNKSPMGMFRR